MINRNPYKHGYFFLGVKFVFLFQSFLYRNKEIILLSYVNTTIYYISNTLSHYQCTIMSSRTASNVRKYWFLHAIYNFLSAKMYVSSCFGFYNIYM